MPHTWAEVKQLVEASGITDETYLSIVNLNLEEKVAGITRSRARGTRQDPVNAFTSGRFGSPRARPKVTVTHQGPAPLVLTDPPDAVELEFLEQPLSLVLSYKGVQIFRMVEDEESGRLLLGAYSVVPGQVATVKTLNDPSSFLLHHLAEVPIALRPNYNVLFPIVEHQRLAYNIDQGRITVDGYHA